MGSSDCFVIFLSTNLSSLGGLPLSIEQFHLISCCWDVVLGSRFCAKVVLSDNLCIEYDTRRSAAVTKDILTSPSDPPAFLVESC